MAHLSCVHIGPPYSFACSLTLGVVQAHLAVSDDSRTHWHCTVISHVCAAAFVLSTAKILCLHMESQHFYVVLAACGTMHWIASMPKATIMQCSWYFSIPVMLRILPTAQAPNGRHASSAPLHQKLVTQVCSAANYVESNTLRPVVQQTNRRHTCNLAFT